MLQYNNEQVIQAFKVYSILSMKGYGEKEELRLYISDDMIRGLVDQFAREVDCTIFVSGDYIYMIPILKNSIFHVSNDSIKKAYFPKKAVNLDLYLMYVAIIVLFGEFYDSYQTMEPTRDFISINEWLSSLNGRIEALNEHSVEKLKELDNEFDYNWSYIIEKWIDMDEIKERVKSQDARTISRKSFLNTVKQFVEAQELVKDIGNEEIELTEKAKTIVQRYYMEYDYNRGILDFMYNLDQKKGEN
ncbi:TPA: non-ribosomal peptide synthetase module [Clostridium botulinum]|nr:non-ribosomal peptide synthetase module [Clostridium botulinum]HDK7158740.1 non-ribosomal peptide synthetase module [Clostridium botulinum]